MWLRDPWLWAFFIAFLVLATLVLYRTEIRGRREGFAASDTQQIDKIIGLYRDILHRDPISKEISSDMSDLGDGTLTMDRLRQKLYTSDEYQRQMKLQMADLTPELPRILADRDLMNHISDMYLQDRGAAPDTKILPPLRDMYIYLGYSDDTFHAFLQDPNYGQWETDVLSQRQMTRESVLAAFEADMNLPNIRAAAQKIKAARLAAAAGSAGAGAVAGKGTSAGTGAGAVAGTATAALTAETGGVGAIASSSAAAVIEGKSPVAAIYQATSASMAGPAKMYKTVSSLSTGSGSAAAGVPAVAGSAAAGVPAVAGSAAAGVPAVAGAGAASAASPAAAGVPAVAGVGAATATAPATVPVASKVAASARQPDLPDTDSSSMIAGILMRGACSPDHASIAIPTRVFEPAGSKHPEDMVLRPEFAWAIPQPQPPVCYSLGQKPIVQPLMNSSRLLLGTPLDDANDTQVGSILPKFEFKPYIDLAVELPKAAS